MFDVQKLIHSICAGEKTLLTVNGRKYPLAKARNLSVTKTLCTGSFPSGLAFALKNQRKNGQVIFSLTLENKGKKAVTLGDIVFFTHKEDSVSGVKKDRAIFGFHDSLGDNYVDPVTFSSGKHMVKPMCLVYDLAGKKTFFSAQRTFERNVAAYELRFDPKKALLKSMKCFMEVMDYSLCPGQKVTTDELVLFLSNSRDPFDVLESWAEDVHGIYKPDIPERSLAGFITGLMVSTKAESSVDQIRRQTKAAGQLRKLGLEYIWISIDNLKDSLAGNWLTPNRKNFANGVRAFVEEMTLQGFKPGLWIAPFYQAEGSTGNRETTDFQIRKKDGGKADRGRWLWGKKDASGNLPLLHALDPADIRSTKYIEKVFRTYADWGIRYHMIDFLSSGLYRKEDLSSGFCREHYYRFLRSIKKFVAPDTHLLGASGTSISLIGAVHSNRIGADYGEGRPLEPQFPSYPANYVINGSFGSAGAPNRNAVTNLAMWYFAHDRFFQCNSNMMTVDKPIPVNEAQIAATLFGMSPGPVFFGDDMERMSPERLALLKKVLPRCPGMPLPADLFAKTDVRTDFVRTFILPVRREWGTWYICAVFNLNDSFRKLDLKGTLLRLEKNKSYRMYDFWMESYMGIFRNEKSIEIPANSCRVFRFEEVREHPWILSTDFHVRQGDAELQEVVWDEKKLRLSGKCKRASGEEGNIFLISPDSFMEKNHNRGLMVSKTAIDGSLIIKKHILFRKETESWSIDFLPCDKK
ncbi:MAG: hypothetical protein J6A21_05685 [Lentisphaeria bacterium]|nr:hypothetical protein [Lentisphaeria bacterium]